MLYLNNKRSENGKNVKQKLSEAEWKSFAEITVPGSWTKPSLVVRTALLVEAVFAFSMKVTNCTWCFFRKR